MVKPPRIRHSKSKREPATIDIEPNPVGSGKGGQPAADEPVDQKTAAGASTTPVGTGKATTDERVATQAGKTSSPDAASASSAGEVPSGSATFGRPDLKTAQSGASLKSEDAGSTRKEDPKRAPLSSPPPRRSGLIAGIGGGALVLLAGVALQYAGLLPGPRPVIDAGSQTVGELQTEIASLREEVARLTAAPPATVILPQEALTRFDALSTELERMRGELTAIGGDGSASTADDGAVSALGERLAAIEGRLDEVAASAGAGSDAAIAAVEDRVAAAEAAGREAAAEAGGLSERISALETRIGELATSVEEQADNPRIALAISAAGLKAAIDRGTPFMTELETYAAVAPDAPEIADLRALAPAGVPTRAEIVADMPAAANAMVNADRPADPDAGIVDRLLSSARSMVTVRPVGVAEGPGVPETVARMEAAIMADDLPRALAEYETLPPAAQQAGAALAAKIRARRSADELVDRALSGALRS